MAKTKATDPLPDAAHAYVLADILHFWCLTPQQVLGSHQHVFHVDMEISWGKPTSPWKKQAYLEMGKIAGLEIGAQPSGLRPPRTSVWANGRSSGLKNKDLPLSCLFPHVFPPGSSERPPGRGGKGRMTGSDRPAVVPALSRPAAGKRAPRRLNGRCRHGNASPLSGFPPSAPPRPPSPASPSRTAEGLRETREKPTQNAASWGFFRATQCCFAGQTK